ncbi:metalloregulator ArsR/SmtB family transcription factor [Plantactinospora sp. KBS50]|uniref:metalloregulator ArsR/SmtB family transcription factor n=1 Tax=Plantactinospora sp. KBS50 TaxID=2024580 RepID=UPI000BAAA4F9|nr:metalloregulator ArsR/SmtB family transcription factor [Plantactinospora sp. KBS50]ASW54339.1 ArsR family transcriptional regulator [Plantactinospora sp. KBS50]
MRLQRTAPDDPLAALERAVVVLRGMAYEHRLHILVLLLDGEQTPASLAEAIAAEPTAIAHHLRYLRAARLIRRRRSGRQAIYTLYSEATRGLIAEVLRYAHSAERQSD